MMAAQMAQEAAASNPSHREAGRVSDLTNNLDGKARIGSLRNRASESASPYVHAHSDTPVAWQLFDEDAIARARKENKLIFLNIGFRACHYCRLTTQDSFSNPAVAELLNEHFIPIIVDREERPDIDAVYMNYIQAVNGAGGWPLNVFLTPELEPVFGSTYWPGPGVDQTHPLSGSATTAHVGRGAVSATAASSDTEDEDRLDFLVILKKLRKIWAEQETRCRKEAKEILVQLRDFAAEGTLGTRGDGALAAKGPGSAGEAVPVGSIGSDSNPTSSVGELEVDLDQLEEAYSHLARTFDAVNGGFGTEPKFPTPAKLSFLLRLRQFPQAVRDVVGEKEAEHAKFMALQTLRRLRDSGLRDHIGGGFARYSVTADWTMPHFEKMVTDNALLLDVYLDAWLSEAKDGALSLEDEFADIVVELVDYLTTKPVALDAGGFSSSEAADSYYKKGDRHMREGAYYLWTRREFDAVVGKDDDTAATYWNVLEHGNIPRELDPQDEFINQNVLHVVKEVAEISKQLGIPARQVRQLIAQARERLRLHREKERVRPETDDKVVTAYNGMVISALARAAGVLQYVDHEKSREAQEAAVAAAIFLRRRMWDSESKFLYRTRQPNRQGTPALAEDYAFLIEASLQLDETLQGKGGWLEWANELQEAQMGLFYDRESNRDKSSSTSPQRTSSSGAFYSTFEPNPQIILRLKDGMDTAQPSTNAVSASNLFRLGALLGRTEYSTLARETIAAFEAEILQYPWLFVGLLSSVVSARLGGMHVVQYGEPDEKDLKAVKAWYMKPRAELRTLVFLPAEGEEVWVAGQNRALGAFKKEKRATGWYVLQNGGYSKQT